MNNLKTLTPIELDKVWETEPQHFTPWLAKEENLTLLGEALGMELELDAQEISVGGFRADLRCKNTADDSWVIIENQLEATDHRHVGQLLTYAAGLDAHTVIWIAKTFRQEYRAMLDWQNRITHEPYRFFGVEVKVWQIGNSDRAVQFEVVSSPNDWTRDVSRHTDLSETEQQLKKYWTGLRDYVADKGNPINFRTPGKRAFQTFSIGKGGFSLMAWVLRSTERIGIRLVMRGRNAEAHFRLLEEQQEEIYEEFGEPLEWNELPNDQSCRISLYKHDADFLDEDDWPQQYEWFTTNLERFDQVFRDPIKALDVAGWIPHEDDDQ